MIDHSINAIETQAVLEYTETNFNATIFRTSKTRLPQEIKEGLKQRGCHWNDNRSAYSCERSQKVVVSTYLEVNGIQVESEDINDGYFLLSKGEQAADRINQFKMKIVRDGSHQFMYVQSLIQDYNKKYETSLKYKDFEEITTGNLISLMSSEDVRELDLLKIIHLECDKFKKNRDLEAELRKKAELLGQNDEAVVSGIKESELAESASVFKPYTFQELLGMPPKTWLIDRICGSGDVGMIYGPPGCGKTFIVIEMIICMCMGIIFARCFTVLRPLNVAYCAGEGISGLPSRFKVSAKHHGINTLHNFTFFKTIPQFYDNQNTIQRFIDECKARQLAKELDSIDVLIIDTLHTAITGADENSSQDMGKVVQLCRVVADELGCAVILVHHTNKTGTSERGSSSLRGAMDFMIRIEKPSDAGIRAVMSCEKLKDGEAWEDLSFQLDKIEGEDSVYVLWSDSNNSKPLTKSKAEDKKKLQDEMDQSPGRKFTCKSLSEVIAQSTNYTNNLLRELVDNKVCERELSDPSKESSNRNPWVYFSEYSKGKVKAI